MSFVASHMELPRGYADLTGFAAKWSWWLASP
jgi:hypothetical protein